MTRDKTCKGVAGRAERTVQCVEQEHKLSTCPYVPCLRVSTYTAHHFFAADFSGDDQRQDFSGDDQRQGGGQGSWDQGNPLK